MAEQEHGEDVPLGPQTQSAGQVKTATAVIAGNSLLFLSGLMLAGTGIGLVVAIPFWVIFSPVLVPGVITVSLLLMGFMVSGGLVVIAVSVLSWVCRRVTGENPTDVLGRMKLAAKAKYMHMKESASP